MCHDYPCFFSVRFDFRKGQDFEKIEKKAELIVVAPLNMNGTEGPRSEKCRAFAQMLSELSAILILQDYIDRNMK